MYLYNVVCQRTVQQRCRQIPPHSRVAAFKAVPACVVDVFPNILLSAFQPCVCGSRARLQSGIQFEFTRAHRNFVRFSSVCRAKMMLSKARSNRVADKLVLDADWTAVLSQFAVFVGWHKHLLSQPSSHFW